MRQAAFVLNRVAEQGNINGIGDVYESAVPHADVDADEKGYAYTANAALEAAQLKRRRAAFGHLLPAGVRSSSTFSALAGEKEDTAANAQLKR